MFYLLSPFRIDRLIDDDIIVYKRSKLLIEKINSWKLYISPITSDSCRFIIECSNRKKAYELYHLIRGYYLVKGDIWVHGPANKGIGLYEYTKHPRLTWKKSDWINKLNRNVHQINIDDWMYFNGELNGTDPVGVTAGFENFIELAIDDESITNSLNCLYESILLFDGYIESTYPEPYYRSLVPVFSVDIIERAYYENRVRYELAFLAAYKGIEHILGVNDFKKNDIKKILDNSNIIQSNSDYNRRYENIVGYKINDSWSIVLSHFVDIRNTVAAHGNKKPPNDKIINFYSIYEIQNMLTELIESKSALK